MDSVDDKNEVESNKEVVEVQDDEENTVQDDNEEGDNADKTPNDDMEAESGNSQTGPESDKQKGQAGTDLLSYIQTRNQLLSLNEENDDGDSVGTANAGNQSKRDVNQALDGYKTPAITTNIVYCKAKIQIPSSDKPTETMRNTFGMFLTTLLKVDKDFVLYLYKDEANAGYIKLPTQVPEVMSKIKLYFHGRYRL